MIGCTDRSRGDSENASVMAIIDEVEIHQQYLETD